MDVDFPFHFDGRGHTATTGTEDHVRDMIEQLILTSPGERVNRSDFGSALLQLVFAPNSSELQKWRITPSRFVKTEAIGHCISFSSSAR